MGKIVLLVAREEMLFQAHNILQEKKYEIASMKVIRTEDSVSEAREAIAERRFYYYCQRAAGFSHQAVYRYSSSRNYCNSSGDGPFSDKGQADFK